MMVNESVQTSRKMEQKAFEERIIKEGLDLWKKQKEFELRRKIQEQKEIRNMMDTYWPWGKGTDARPRGLRNIRLDELFPNKEYMNAKRYVGGSSDINRPIGGGGAPIFSNGKKITRTCEDPVLRFQFGSKDLRRCVDNTLRYKTNKEQQQEYKKELDKLVAEKKQKEKQEKTDDIRFHQEQGWSDETTLKNLGKESTKPNFKKINGNKPNYICNITSCKPSLRLDPIAYPRRNFIPVGRNRKLSPLSENKDEGVELVTLLAKDRNYPPKIPLCSSDITSEKKMGNMNPGIWSREGSAYLKVLAEQMMYKKQKMQEMKNKEYEICKKHFSTWTGFWGRPGNGAPLPEIRKQCLDNMLYPKMTPIPVH
ncbi:uncharacterized protein LOC130899653 isoform X1 [Diorhabda carinulata]|uniref:uncharacterized protein LOC130899653 isoform X1 n=1 Tax=Diorhabda carinulata TaxID=1163345 RepID=UPI0025A1B0C2|nr:uncharacterized protein LOC130899653 isoform X1 [Diorhabda carinulata]